MKTLVLQFPDSVYYTISTELSDIQQHGNFRTVEDAIRYAISLAFKETELTRESLGKMGKRLV